MDTEIHSNFRSRVAILIIINPFLWCRFPLILVNVFEDNMRRMRDTLYYYSTMLRLFLFYYYCIHIRILVSYRLWLVFSTP